MFKLIYKNKGESSFSAIYKFAKTNNIKKIGHTGTLDPLACGLLLVATNDDTKLIPYIKNKEKTYVVEMKLGYESKTFDEEGPITFISSYQPSKDEIIKTLNFFVGDIKQIPPIFSAKKINGRRAYKLARDNQNIEMKPINVKIFSITNIEYNYPYLKFHAHVSNGTYIRSLVNDIGKKLSTGAYMSNLERTVVNGLKLGDEINIYKLTKLNSIKISSVNELNDWFNGKIKEIKIENDDYLLEFNKTIIGVLQVESNNVVKTKLFGNTIKKILNY